LFVFPARGKGRPRTLAPTQTKSYSSNSNRHEFEITQNESGQITFEKNETKTPNLNSTFDDRKRRNFLPNFLIELRILIRRQLNHRISQHHDSLPPQLIIKFFVVPGIL
jgi:hypothetical protein